MPIASVVVPSRNRVDGLRRLLHALVAQRTDRTFEVVVVDDASSPPYNPTSLLEGLPNARLIRGRGHGPAAARNLGIRESRGDFVIFADDDTEPDEGWVEAACAFLDTNPNCVGVEGAITSRDWDPLYEMSARVSAAGSYLTANIAFRRSVLLREGGFDAERFPMHGEDLDLAYRMQRHGPIGFERRMVSEHHPRRVPAWNMIDRGRLHVNDIELFRSHAERYGRVQRFPAFVFPLINVVMTWAGIARRERASLLRPARAARFVALAAGQTLRAAVAVAASAVRNHRAARQRPTRLLVLMSRADRGAGAENMLWEFMRHIDRSRIEPVVVFTSTGSLERDVAALGIATNVIDLRGRRPVIVRAGRLLGAIFRRTRPHVALTWMPDDHPHMVAGALAARWRGSLVWWQHNIVAPTRGERLVTALPARAVGASSAAIAASQRAVRPHRDTFVVHPGIAEPDSLDENARATLRERLALPPDVAVIGIVGRIVSWKRQDEVIRAVALLRERGYNVHGLVVGGDPHDLDPSFEPALRRLVAALQMRDHVTFTGHVPNPTAYMQIMDVVVNASACEPFGIVLLEALALGVPIVAVRSGGPAEIINDGMTGRLVDSPTAELLAEGILFMLDDHERTRSIVAVGQQAFRERFTAYRMAEDLTRELLAITRN